MTAAKPVALITGIWGQDGQLLSQLLVEKGYRVVGVSRRTSTQPTGRELSGDLVIRRGDITDQRSIEVIVEEFKPHEFYNLAAESFVENSWTYPIGTAESTALGVTKCILAIMKYSPKTRFFQASTSEIFGDVSSAPQDEETPLRPRSPYATAKSYAHSIVGNYRKRFGLHASCGILYNHESPLRGLEFVTRKITHGAASIKLGRQEKLSLGDLKARRDWGAAADYVQGMWLMLQQEIPADYVLATGETHSVEDFVATAFGHVGLDWQKHVETDPSLYRAPEPVELRGDPSKARKKLGWTPRIAFSDLIKGMVDADLRLLKEGLSR